MKTLLLFLILISSINFPQIKFSANFESGNLLSASTTDSINYAVKSREDIGSRWFYFMISGVKNKFIKVTVSNSDVTRAVYSYDNINFTRFSAAESPAVNVFQKTFENDSVYVAYYAPYTFSYLMKRINKWNESEFVKVDTLGFTPKNLPMQEIILTDFTVPDSLKYSVWIHARTHPGETPSSFHFDGIVETLLKNDDVINFYRKNIVFHLIPFDNPDGVYYGRSRTNYANIDLERDWNFDSLHTTKEISIIKSRLAEINSANVVKVFLNLHSQAASYCTFWIHTSTSTSINYYTREHQFTNLNVSDIPYFAMNDYSFSNLQPYFPEGWLWNNYGDNIMALTYETPYDQYSNGAWVTNENLAELGERTVFSIAEYLKLSYPKYIILDNDDAQLIGNWTTDSSGLLFYGNNFVTAEGGFGNNKIEYETETLEPGNYDVWGWYPSNSSLSSNSKFRISASENIEVIKSQKTDGGQWNYLADASLNQEEKIFISLDDNANGKVAADAFRIIYNSPISSVKENIQPKDFVLFQNYPNPFNPSTTIRYTAPPNLPKGEALIQLKIYDVLGNEIAVLVNEQQQPGTYEVNFNASNLASGVYFYRLTIIGSNQNKNLTQTKKLLFLK